MMKVRYAYFVNQPSRIKDLFRIHAVDQERQYVISKTIELPLIDYENFILDLTVDRQFLEDNAKYCSKVDFMGNIIGIPYGVDHDGIWKCLLVKRMDHDDGILVITSNGSWVGWAAYYKPA